MDFWTKLIGGVSNNKSATAAASSPQQRLQRFRRAYNPILQLCGRPQTLASHGPALDQLYSSLQKITALLAEESRTPAPHLCLNFAQSSQVYSVVARAASTSRDERLIRQATLLFSLLLESEDEDFVASAAFATSFMRFALRVIDSNSGVYGEEIEADVVELMFAVVAKIRIQPNILSVWFSSSATKDDDSQRDSHRFAGQTQKDDFPLCYLLIDRIHHDGRIGDFARTGLLYIFEAVSNSTHLEEWIIESDLPTLMASGLGALYSQLSRELSIAHDHDRLPMILALSDYVDAQQTSSTESIFSPTHATHMATFLSHLAFWQDVLEHCKSESVKFTLLDHFRILFLQQLLYPSLLQSSDTDGGSSVAVLTYLTNIFESLDHPDLTRLVLQYLLAIPDTQSEPISPTVQRRQSTLMLLSQSQNDEDKFEPTLFNLVDLILNGVRSQNPQTVVAALKLSSVMLTRHRKYTTPTLLQSKSILSAQEKRTIQALCAETDGLIQIATGLGGEADIDEAYATACQDVTVPLEVQMANKTAEESSVLKLLSHDPYVQSIADLFGSFFTNSVDINLALTEATICLASCANVGLDGWLTVPRTEYQAMSLNPTFDSTSLDEEEAASLRLLQSVYSQQRREDSKDPLLPAALRALRSQVDHIRSDIPILDYLIEKRVAILGGAGREESMTQPKAPTGSNRQSTESSRPTENRQIQRLQAGSRQRSSSRESSMSRSSTPARVRDGSLSSVPPRSSSLPQTPQAQQQNSIFRPPPPESPEDESLPSENLSMQTESKQNEAQTLRSKIRFTLGQLTEINTIFEYASGSVAHDQMGECDDLESREATLSHVVTNIVILQHFVLELAAVMRTRAIVFEEVAFA